MMLSELEAANESIPDVIAGVEQEIGYDGWPCLRHYNEKTGPGGEAYIKTNREETPSKELGDPKSWNKPNLMLNYVEKATKTKICDIKKLDACPPKMQKYVEMWFAKGKEAVRAERERLRGALEGIPGPTGFDYDDQAKWAAFSKLRRAKYLMEQIALSTNLKRKQDL